MTKERKPKVTRYEEWLGRPVNRCAVLGVDPGSSAGAALATWTPDSIDVRWGRAVETDTLELERCIEDAATFARSRGLPLIVAIEDWGKGGPLGIDQWLGLGAAAGAWKRATMLACDRHAPVLMRSRATTRINQRTWRSAIIEEAGTRDDAGKFRPFDTVGWKRAATARVFDLFGHRLGVLDSNASEAVLLAYYAMRFPPLGAMIPKRPIAV